MKVILQNKVSLLYFKDGANWISDWAEARDFGSSLKAIDFCRQHHLKQMQVVLKFADQKYDITLQMVQSQKSGKSPRKHA